jgi:hypothetical protein
MIKNFEEITAPLNEEELKLVDIIIDGLKKRGKEEALKGDEICERINKNKEKLGLKKNLSDARLRKITNHIRTQGLLPIIATSKGYYCSYNVIEIRAQIDSLEDRAKAIQASADGLRKFL